MSEAPFVVGSTVPDDPADRMITIEGKDYDLKPIFDAITQVGQAETLALRNPYSMEPMRMLAKSRAVLVGSLNRPMPRQLVPVVRPLIQHAAGPMHVAAQEAIRLRMHASNKLMQHPTQTIPITLSIAPGGTAGPIAVQNPYQGSGGGTYNTNALWAITGLESGALANTGTLLISSAVFAGHDYVAAALGGIASYGGPSPQPATRGWGAFIFASDKRERAHTTFSPWNLQGAGGIIGSIMRETGQASFTFANIGGGPGSFNGVFHVHVKASLCGSPFSPQHLGDMFVPWKQQLAASHSLAQHWPNQMARQFQSLGHNLRLVSGLEEELENVLGGEMFFPS